MLLNVMLWARDERARARARAAVESAWATNDAARDELWHASWRLLASAHFDREWFREDRVGAVLRFLLERDPTSRYVPRVRLLACLPPESSSKRPRAAEREPELAPLIRIAIGDKDFPARDALLELLCTTDHPRLLTELIQVFRKNPSGLPNQDRRGNTYDLWDDNGEPRPLMRILRTNPHLTLPPEIPATALVFLQMGRFDRLSECDPEDLVRTLLATVAAVHQPHLNTPPSHIMAACRRALRELTSAEAQALVCWKAIAGDAEALAAARDAGYRPFDDKLQPLFFFLTEQWDVYNCLDPDGSELATGLIRLPRNQIKKAIARLLDPSSLPEVVAEKARFALRHLPSPAEADDSESLARLKSLDKELRSPTEPPHQKDQLDDFLTNLDSPRMFARNLVCIHAMRGNAEAKAAATDAGYLPSKPKLQPAFLFLTEQWDAYDRLDPDGTRLQTVLAESWRYGLPLSEFEEVAERAGRPVPEPPEPRTSHRRHRSAGAYHTDFGAGDSGGGYDGGGSYDGGGGYSGFSGFGGY
ncbi:hypothetical protein [Saccharomonospora glauca]|uniref:Uncharacterized protein n=1 Tax=Saccharomonospora glauca K62 TaxID=928724 RepID=I1D2M4_9PSEU|nr:hypothetical protein [Saccharomonospora glauca]EIE99198.1 hypothetical protein SacglDRAFT_02303 [Saccharomonospora glauca K62]